MKRNEIDSQLTWDLRFLFENQEAFEAQFALAQKEIKLLQAALSSLADDRASFISFMSTLKICRTRKIWHAAIPCISR